MNVRIVTVCFLVLSSSPLLSFVWSTSDINSLTTEAAAEQAQKTLQQQLDQAFFLSTDYLAVVSTMQQSGVMDRYSTLVATLQSGSDVDPTEMSSVVTDLTSLCTSMISAYSNLSVTANNVTTAYPKAVIANPANGVYSFYSTVVSLYIARLQYLANQITVAVSAGSDYTDEAAALFTAFSDYTTSLNSIILEFPTTSSNSTIAAYYATLPALAINDYYSQAAQTVLPVLLSVVNSAKSATDDQYNVAIQAMNLYTSLMATTNIQQSTNDYAAFSGYQSAFLTALYTVCNNAGSYVSKSIDFVANTQDQNATFFNDQVTLYSSAAAIFKNISGFSSNYSVLNNALTDAENKLTAFTSAYDSINSIQALYDTIIADMQTSQTKSDLLSLLNSIAAPLNNCTTTQAELTLIGDVLAGATLKTLDYKLYKTYYIILFKYLWALFMADTVAGGAELEALYGSLIPNDATFTADFATLNNCMQSIYAVCSSTSNSYLASYFLANEISYAIDYANAAAASSTAVSTTSSATTDILSVSNLQIVQELVTLVSDFATNFVALNSALASISASELSPLKAMIGKVIGSAIKIDSMYAENSFLTSYISNLATASGADSYQSFAMDLITYILENQAQVQSSDIDVVMVCYALLQSYSEYITDANESYIVTALKSLSNGVNSEETANVLATQAQTGTWELVNNRMQNTVWLSAIELYLIVYQLEKLDNYVTFAEDLSPLVETINTYISTYSTTVAAADQQPLDLLFLYYLLMNYYTYSPTFATDIVMPVTDLPTALSCIADLFNNNNKTGYFDQLSAMLTEFQNETDPTKLASEKQAILDQMIIFENYMHAEQAWIAGAQLLYGITVTSMFSVTTAADGSTTFACTSGTNVLSMVVPDLDAVLAAAVKAIADTAFADGQTASDQKDFATAAEKYTDAATSYKTIIDATEATSDVTQQYYLSLTRAEASSIANTVVRSNIATISDISDVALTYLLSSYSLVIPTIIASSLASNYTTSSTATTTDGTTSLSWTNDQIVTVLSMIALNSELTNAGYTYNELYDLTKGTMVRVPGLDSNDSAQCDAFEATVNDYISIINTALTVGNEVNGNALMMTATATQDVAGNITLTMQNMPVAPLNGYYADAPVAESYFAMALLLFNTGTDNVMVGNSVYVPGNDATAAQNMRLYIAATSLATAEIYSQEIATYMSTLATTITDATTSDLQTQLVTDFTTNVTDVFNLITGALLNSTGGVIEYYTQNNLTEYAANAQAYAMQIYSDYQTNVAKLLVGDPTTKIYTSLLNTLNLAYLSQAEFETDASAAASLKDQSANLLKITGDACGAYKTTVDNTDQYYYKNAAEYYIAAVTQYTTNGNNDQVAAVTILENQALAKAGMQEINNYYYIKNNSIDYANTSGKTVSTTFADMVSTYSAFTSQSSITSSSAMDPNELTLYNEIIDLFLDGAMLLTAASSGSTSSTSTSTTTTSSSSTPTAEDEGGLNADIVDFLQKNNVTLTATQLQVDVSSSDTDSTTTDAGDSFLDAAKNAVSNLGSSDSSSSTDSSTETLTVYTIDPSDATINQQLCAVGIAGIETFAASSNQTAMSAWLSLLYKAASYLYISDYLGGITGSDDTAKASDYATKLQTFVQVVQGYGVSLQNPVSAYMG
jgi:hypothetical protein